MNDDVMRNKFGKLCVITDTNIQNKYSHAEIAEMALKVGADIIQFRDKFMKLGELVSTASEILKLCRKHNAKLIINDRVDIAMLTGADGVHLGGEDLSVKDARKLLGKNKIIGATAHSIKEAIDAEKCGADYIGYGHIFETSSKIRNSKPKGINKLKEVCSKIKIPVIAIGGIGIENAGTVMNSGAHGIAVIGSVVNSENPVDTVRKLKEIQNGFVLKKEI